MELGKDMYVLSLGPITVVEHSISQLIIIVNLSPVKCSWSEGGTAWLSMIPDSPPPPPTNIAAIIPPYCGKITSRVIDFIQLMSLLYL